MKRFTIGGKDFYGICSTAKAKSLRLYKLRGGRLLGKKRNENFFHERKKIFLLNLIALRVEIILQLQGCFGTLGSVHKFCKQGKKNKTATPKKLFQDFFIFLFFFRVLSLSGQSKQAYRHVLFNFLLFRVVNRFKDAP